MNRKSTFLTGFVGLVLLACFSFREAGTPATYAADYRSRIQAFSGAQQQLLALVRKSDLKDTSDLTAVREGISQVRLKMKGMDFWMRYLDPLAYKQINGPLPVEWETEVFEKFEKPYKRDGAGLTLAAVYLDEEQPDKDSLLHLISAGDAVLSQYTADAVMRELGTYHHFFLCNRLFLLNLAAIYTTGFENPDTAQIIPELRAMLQDVRGIYDLYNESFPNTPVSDRYLGLYDSAIAYADRQPAAYSAFDHYTFLRAYVNPLFAVNAQLIKGYGVVSHSLIDYSLNKAATSIFSKNLYFGQSARGVFTHVRDSAALAEIDRIGKLLFYDPILSGNNMRSCASCHKPGQYFTDTAVAAAFAFNHQDFLPRNTPSLVNADYNHLIMADGRHISLQHQTRDVITAGTEMGSTEAEVLRKVLSCGEYKKAFTALLKYTPHEPEISFAHISSAITFYYCKFSKAAAPFDVAMNGGPGLTAEAREGFNVFMSKAQCATCHFVPQFNGVKPPYIGSEFEVLGVPADTGFSKLSADSGRGTVNLALQTIHAFRTGTLRNAARTAPYMHNGVFRSIREVIDFYDRGGGAGRGLDVPNQTLSSERLGLSEREKQVLALFIESLNEDVPAELAPERLPHSGIARLNKRKVGGEY